MAETAPLVVAYTAYKTRNIKIKARQSHERTDELKPMLAAVGKAVIEMQAAGMTITEIGQIIGLKNRNFIYDAKRAYQGLPELDEQDEPVEVAPDIESYWEHLASGLYRATVDGVSYDLFFDEDGNLELPPEFLDPISDAYKKVYQQIIKEVTEHYEATA